MEYSVEIAASVMIYIPSFMNIGTGAQGILRFCLRNFRGCSGGVTDGRDL
jgi:hypothetical protein